MSKRLSVTPLLAGVVTMAMVLPVLAASDWSDGPAWRIAQARPAPTVSDEDQISPRQIQQENSARPARSQRAANPAASGTATAQTGAPSRSKPAPAAAAPAANAPAAAPAAPSSAPRPMAHAPAGAPKSVSCAGVFGKDSTHLKLAIAFDSKNLAFTEVDGPDNSRLNASVVYPNDPKRRIEILWQNEAARADIALIVIGGQSQWSGPKGLRIGMPIAALEKANGKPFSLSGLDQDNGGSALDWKGGAFASLPGGCKVGVRLSADPKAPAEARAAVAGKELESKDAALKAARLSVAEIIIGY